MNKLKVDLKNIDRQYIIRAVLLIIYDIAAIECASFMALFIRFDFTMNDEMIKYFAVYRSHQLLIIVFTLVIFAACHLYTSLWSYASIREMVNIMLASILYMMLVTAVFTFLEPENIGMPRSFFLLSGGFLFVLVFFSRFIYRAVREFKGAVNSDVKEKRALIVGAGAAGAGQIGRAHV